MRKLNYLALLALSAVAAQAQTTPVTASSMETSLEGIITTATGIFSAAVGLGIIYLIWRKGKAALNRGV